MERIVSSERGQVLILWILAATVILVIGALVVDVGLWLTERRRAQLAADFAALAAATELHEPSGDPVGKGLDFAKRNGFDDADPGVEVLVDPNYAPDMVEVTINQGSPMLFSGIFGAGAFDIGARAVGTDPAQVVDVVMILDRSASIEGTQPKTALDLGNAKGGAKAALAVLDPTIQRVALGVMWASNLSGFDNGCSFIDNSWIPVTLRDDYKDPGNPLVGGIDCLGLSNQGTDWATPIGEARNLLQAGSARKAIILLADGHPQDPGSDPCESAVDQAAQAKAAGIEIYTIGYAIENDDCSDDSGGSSYNGSFAEALAAIATDSDDNHNHCASPSDVIDENSDSDHFFCQLRSDDLAPVFTLVAQDLARDYRLEE